MKKKPTKTTLAWRAQRPAPEPRRTRARPDGSTRRQVRPKPVRTEFGRKVLSVLDCRGMNRTDLAELLKCPHQRVHQVLADPRIDAPEGTNATMDGWRERIRAALADDAPAVAYPAPRPPVEPIPDAVTEGEHHDAD